MAFETSEEYTFKEGDLVFLESFPWTGKILRIVGNEAFIQFGPDGNCATFWVSLGRLNYVKVEVTPEDE